MELFFLGADYIPVTDPADRITSLVWSRRFFECGSFSVHMPPGEGEKYTGASFVYNPAAGEYGRIERISRDADGSAAISGRLLESLFCDRIVTECLPMSGNLEEVIRTVAANNAIGDRQIPYLTLGAPSGLTESVTAEKVRENLSDWMYGILRPFGMSYRLRYDPETARVVFGVVRGTDRGPGSGAPAVFSTDLGTLVSVETDYSEGEMKNVAFVEGGDGYVTTSVRAGIDRDDPVLHREMFVSAHDVSPDDYRYYADYVAALRNRGNSVLREYEETLCVRGETAPGAPGYRTDFDLGDVVTVDTGRGVAGVRVTAVDEISENGTERVEITFGERLTDVRRFLLRGLRNIRSVV